MAITQRYSTNAAIQYNESLDDFKIADSTNGKRFLTEAPLNRLIRENELSALYFLIDDDSFNGATILKFKDEDGTLLFEDNTNIVTTNNIHNGLLVGFSGVPYFVPENTRKICALISGSPNLFLNPDFSQGSGNLFTSWTLNQPSRTNLALRSQEFDNASWTLQSGGAGSAPVVTANNVTAPDGTMTADRIVFNSGAGTTTSDLSLINQTIAQSNGSTYSGAIYLRGNVGGEQIVFRHAGNGAYTLITLTTEWVRYRQIETALGANAVFSFGIRQGSVGTINSTATIYAWGAQFEAGAFTTPYIPTTTASVTTSLGEFLQDATGGIDGGRCLKMWASTGSTSLRQSIFVAGGVQYKVSFWARVDKLYGNDSLTGPADASLILSTEWTYYEQIPYTQVGTGSFSQFFDFTNDANYGFVYLDKISIVNADENALTEERCFELDTRCFANENTIQWINKLGGVDTWAFTGNPIETRNTEREGLIEYPMQDNYQAPNEIYAYRSIKSHEVMNLFHRCDNEETAIWLRSELQDCIQAYLKVGDDYHPIIPTTSSVQIRNYAQRDPNVRFTFRFAYDINIQRR